jgi:hypothetical protein
MNLSFDDRLELINASRRNQLIRRKVKELKIVESNGAVAEGEEEEETSASENNKKSSYKPMLVEKDEFKSFLLELRKHLAVNNTNTNSSINEPVEEVIA